MSSPAINNPHRTKNYQTYFLFLFIGLLAYFIFRLEIYQTLAITIFTHQLVTLYLNLGEKIAIRPLIGTMFALNYLLSPLLMYLWLEPYADELWIMREDPSVYFQYAVPAILLLIIGLNIASKDEEEKIDIKEAQEIVDQYPKLPLFLILSGIAATFLINYVPSALQVYFFALSYLKVIGFLLSILSRRGFSIFLFLLSYGLLTFQSLSSSMFNDFLNMLFFLGFFLCVRYKPSHFFKIGGIVAGILIVAFIQMIKFPLRNQLSSTTTFNIEMLNKAIKAGKANTAQQQFEEKVLNIIFRVNQAWFTSSTMNNYRNGGFELQKGKHSLFVVETALLPKVLAPNRIDIGDPLLFNKYSGHFVDTGTSMALGILSDGFIDFGYYGIFIVALFGLVLNLFIKFFHKLNDKFLLVKVFSPLCLFYAIKPDTDTQSALGSLVKGTLIVLAIIVCLKYFYLKNLTDRKLQLSTK